MSNRNQYHLFTLRLNLAKVGIELLPVFTVYVLLEI